MKGGYTQNITMILKKSIHKKMKKYIVCLFLVFFSLLLVSCNQKKIEEKKQTNEIKIKSLSSFVSEGVEFLLEENLNFDLRKTYLFKTKIEIDEFKNDVPKYLKEKFSKKVYELILEDDKFFENKFLIVAPFLYSSSDKERKIKELKFNNEEKKFEVIFELYSPEFHDTDIYVEFHITALSKNDVEKIDLYSTFGGIIIYNTRNGSDKCSYYGGNND